MEMMVHLTRLHNPFMEPRLPLSHGPFKALPENNDPLETPRIEDWDPTGYTATHRTAQPLRSCEFSHPVPSCIISCSSSPSLFSTLALASSRLEALADRFDCSPTTEENGYHGTHCLGRYVRAVTVHFLDLHHM